MAVINKHLAGTVVIGQQVALHGIYWEHMAGDSSSDLLQVHYYCSSDHHYYRSSREEVKKVTEAAKKTKEGSKPSDWAQIMITSCNNVFAPVRNQARRH